MITKQFTFFSFMLSWSMLVRLGLMPPLGFLMAPLIYLVSGKKYLGYFLLINIILTAPNLINVTTIYQYTMTPLVHLQSVLNNAPNDTAKQQLSRQFIYNISGIQFGEPTGNVVNIPLFIVSILTISGSVITFVILIYTTYKGIKMYMKMFRMIRAVIHRKSFNAI